MAKLGWSISTTYKGTAHWRNQTSTTSNLEWHPFVANENCKKNACVRVTPTKWHSIWHIYIYAYIYIYSGNLWYSFWPGILSGVRLVPTVTTSWHTEGGEVWVGRREWDSEWVALLTKSRDPHLACGKLPWKVWNSWSIASWWQIYIYMYTYVFAWI